MAGRPGTGRRAAYRRDTPAELDERTADLQRVTAEYANYRKRVDRDRAATVEAATGSVLAALLPVLDDVDRARQHGDLTGAFKAVADQLEATGSHERDVLHRPAELYRFVRRSAV